MLSGLFDTGSDFLSVLLVFTIATSFFAGWFTWLFAGVVTGLLSVFTIGASVFLSTGDVFDATVLLFTF